MISGRSTASAEHAGGALTDADGATREAAVGVAAIVAEGATGCEAGELFGAREQAPTTAMAAAMHQSFMRVRALSHVLQGWAKKNEGDVSANATRHPKSSLVVL
jgi:hypothetical protein